MLAILFLNTARPEEGKKNANKFIAPAGDCGSEFEFGGL
jgi:hypothetical protein